MPQLGLDNYELDYDSTNDNVIVRHRGTGNEFTIDDGQIATGDTDHAATDHESGGSLEIAHNNLSLGSDDHHVRPAPGTLLSEDGSNNFNVDLARDTATASGDGVAVTFTLTHSLGATPTVAHIQATSADAAGDLYISNKTSSDVDVTFASAPASGTDNLTFDIITA